MGDSTASVGDSGRELVPQPHGGALSRSGRKKGSKNRPKPTIERVQAAAGRKCVKAIGQLAKLIENPDTAAGVKVQAIGLMLAYGIGRPVAVNEHSQPAQIRAYEVTARILGLDQ
ncbi:MAG: hypothetical protein OXQ93_14420 [Gemmatimonadota bacterium]|nr:hypothetical protein [Gemmatimonadota bacterium]